ncbi:hypothetical protein EPIR_0842 [Erwinia piriflorinigrans CFBP 5888]|uniref:Uncharacterized protein n=1 Tax=Erwinia piriflorinigrans CFBP 5888 TaxID=1161919 RepID=V5Z5J9_9GAMM|nr:hypothetical protein EPIR_0842 [Erwinia piriflorinigrans CFBP 5888]
MGESDISPSDDPEKIHKKKAVTVVTALRITK